MNIQIIADFANFCIGLVCAINAIRAFRMYALSRSDVLFILGFSMSSIALAAFLNIISDVHLVPYNTQWARYTCSISGALFIFLSSMVKSHNQLGQLKRAQIIVASVIVVVIALTPVFPPFSSSLIPAILNNIRTVVYSAALIRYAYIYITKESRFSLFISLSFLVLVTGYILVTPQLLQSTPTNAILSIIGTFTRAFGFAILMIAYSFG